MKSERFDDFRLAVIAKRIKHYRSKIGITQEDLQNKSAVDLRVIKNMEAGKHASFNSYQFVAAPLGLSYEQMTDTRMTDIYNSLIDEIRATVEIWRKTITGRSYENEGSFISKFMAMDWEAIQNLENMGLIIGNDRASIFGVMISYKGDIEREFANFLKVAGFSQEQRLFFHHYISAYHLLMSTPRENRREAMLKYQLMMIDVLRRVENVEAEKKKMLMKQP